MLKKILISAAAVGFGVLAVGVSTAALASPPYWAPAYGYRAHAYAPAPRYYYAPPRPVYVLPPPRVYYAPPPVAYYPAPVYRPVPVVPVAPAYPPPYAGSGISIRLNFPL